MRYFSMFSGIGGFELGIQRSYNNKQSTEIEQNRKGWNRNTDEQPVLLRSTENTPLCVGYSEIDKYAIETYKKHFGGHKNYGNAKDIKPEELPDFELLVGGFPCQAFSIAGKRRGFEDTRGTLFFDIARIIKAKQPRMFLLENVKGLLNHDKGETFTTILKTIDELGYDAEWQVLNSKHFGVPQNRERMFIIGHLRGKGSRQIFPIREMSESINGNRESQVSGTIIAQYGKLPTDGCYIKQRKDMIVEKIKGKVEIRKYPVDIDRLKSCLKNHKNISIKEISEKLNVKKTTVEHWFRNDNCFAIPDKDIWFKLKNLLSINTNYFDKSITEFEIRDNEFDQSNRVYHKEGISPTITTLTGGHQHTAINDGYTIRRLTPIECERLQGFPDNWTIGSDTQRYKQCGNAVTVNVIEAIMNKIITHNT